MNVLVFVAHAVATCVMAGVIWVIQLVHYPLFSMVGEAQFLPYHQAHMRLITWIVLPVMGVELGGALWLCADPVAGVPRWMFGAGLALVLLAWGVTALMSVPHHTALAAGFSPHAHAALVGTNWIRTAAWSVRAILMGWMIWTLLKEWSGSGLIDRGSQFILG